MKFYSDNGKNISDFHKKGHTKVVTSIVNRLNNGVDIDNALDFFISYQAYKNGLQIAKEDVILFMSHDTSEDISTFFFKYYYD